jgi:hypothetical protein
MQITLGANSNKYKQMNFRERKWEKQIEWISTQIVGYLFSNAVDQELGNTIVNH